MNIFHLNVRSVNNKSTDLLLSTNSTDYEVIALTETWLDPSQKESEFLDKKYKSFRKDRSESAVESNRGGGVLFAIKKEIECEAVCTPEMDELEAVGIKIKLSNGYLFVICLYIQPSSNLAIYKKYLRRIDSIQCMRNDQMIILGD